MAESATFARPYAKAAFEYADALGNYEAIERWSNALEAVGQAVQQAKIRSFLKNPVLLAEQKARQLIDLADISDDKLCNFIQNLAANRRLLLLPQISQLYNQLKLRRERQVDVQVKSAFSLSSSDQSKLNDTLSGYFSSDVNIQFETDTSLIGGVIIYANGSLIDASIKGRLAKFAEATNS